MPQRAAARASSRVYLVVDLEATCWKGTQPGPNEIIEIGAQIYDAEEGVISEFQSFVRPKLYPQLSDFCLNLTGITQSDVDGAAPFPEVFAKFSAWADEQPLALLTSWGAYDRKQLLMDCTLHHVEQWERLDPHLNLKRAFAALMDCSLAPELPHALGLAGLSQEGTLHRGLDDARNITKILQTLLERFGPERLYALGS